MSERIPQSVTLRVALKAFLSADHVSVATGKTIAIKLSKNGGSFADPSGGATNATEIANGWYYVDLSTTDTGTAGPLIVRGTSSGVDDVEPPPYNVVDAHNAGFDGVPSAAAAATGGLPTVDASNAVKIQTSQIAIKKNTALSKFMFLMLDSTDHVTPKTGLTVTAQRSIDAGSFASCANSVTELANGIYYIDLANTDLNGTVITFKFTSTGADARYVTVVTQA